MSRNTYALLKKNIFGNVGADMRCSSEMGGGHQMIIKNGGGYTSAAKNEGDPCVAKGHAKKGTPLRVFFAPSLTRLYTIYSQRTQHYQCSQSALLWNRLFYV